MKNLLQREERIKSLLTEVHNKKRSGDEIEMFTVQGWRGGKITLPIITIDRDYLMFRIENSRTFRQQLHYIRENEKPINFFSDPESQEVQSAQEEILLQMIHNDTLGPNFIDDLSKVGQNDPAIITKEGYIVNGNRRVAALKELGKQHINCVVLPADTEKRDIYALEHLLQISEDFKEEYHWVNELNNFYEGINDKSINYTEDQMVSIFKISKTELSKKLKMMALVNEFLRWKGIPNQYDYEKLDNAEQAFKDLEMGLRKVKDEFSRREMMHAVFHLIETPPTRGRVYAPLKTLMGNWQEVYDRIKQSEQVPSEETRGEGYEGNSILDELSIDDPQQDVEIFEASENTTEMATELYDVIEDVKAEKAETSKSESVYTGVSSSLRSLQGLTVTDNTTKVEAIKSKLDQIIQAAHRLLAEIEKYE